MIKFVFIFLIQILGCSLIAQDKWVHGSLLVHEVSGQPSMKVLGGERVDLVGQDGSVSFRGVADFNGGYEERVLLSLSNRSLVLFVGDGSFSIERFEQLLPSIQAWGDTKDEVGQSRMIVTFRGGVFFGDCRRMAEFSQCLVETPLGRLTLKDALWYMSIEFDPRSQIFDFTIYCSEGRVRFTDWQGQPYTLRAGQRLAGAGARSAPSIEIGETTVLNREMISEFISAVESVSTDDLELARYVDSLVVMDGQDVASEVEANSNELKSQPIIIDFASDPDLVTPFRGEMRPPSAYQADIF